MASENIKNSSHFIYSKGLMKYFLGRATEKLFNKYLEDKILTPEQISKSLNHGTMSRQYDVIRAAAYDLYRYSTFHDIKIIHDQFDVSLSVLSAYLVKWIVQLRPLNLDEFTDQNFTPVVISNQTFLDQKQIDYFLINRSLILANEYLAVLCVDLIIMPMNDDKYISILDLMDKSEAEAFLYSLRYRLKFQDVYHALFNRIHYDYGKYGKPQKYNSISNS